MVDGIAMAAAKLAWHAQVVRLTASTGTAMSKFAIAMDSPCGQSSSITDKSSSPRRLTLT
jgi:hypothetical protein